VEASVRYLCGRWWRTLTATRSASFDRFCAWTGDARRRGSSTVGELAAAERGIGRGLCNLATYGAVQQHQDTFGDGGSVEGLADALRSGLVQPRDIPATRLVERNKKYCTLDNRRLAAFEETGVDVPHRMGGSGRSRSPRERAMS
jgi:hypothetical protein